MYRVHLTEAQWEELQQRAHAPGVMPRTRDRLEMVRLADAGFTIPKIALLLRISEPRVRYWIKRFLDGGFDALPDQPHQGQKSALTQEILTAIAEELKKADRSWSARQIADWVAERYGLRRSPEHLRRMLKRAQLSYKRTYRILKHKQDPQQAMTKQADLQCLEKGERPVTWISATSTKPASR